MEVKENGNWFSGQIAINKDDNFAIINGKPHLLNYSVEKKSITLTKMSDTNIIPYNQEHNLSLLACFSSDGNYLYALSSFEDNSNKMYPLATFKVDYTNLNSQWQIVSNSLAISNPMTVPVIDPLNKKAFTYVAGFKEAGISGIPDTAIGFYYYYADPEIKDVIGLSWNGNFYEKSW